MEGQFDCHAKYGNLQTPYNLESSRTSISEITRNWSEDSTMYDKIPGLLYLVGVVFTVISWIFLLFSKNVCPKSKEIFILRLSIIWILFFASAALTLTSNLFFDICANLLDSDVFDFYNQRFIQLAPAVTCIINFCVAMYCSIILVKERKRLE